MRINIYPNATYFIHKILHPFFRVVQFTHCTYNFIHLYQYKTDLQQFFWSSNFYNIGKLYKSWNLPHVEMFLNYYVEFHSREKCTLTLTIYIILVTYFNLWEYFRIIFNFMLWSKVFWVKLITYKTHHW